MKTIGLLGGMSWESTVPYYQMINRAVKDRLGGLHSGKILLYSVDFAEIEACQSSGDWQRSAQILGAAAAALERGGADCLVICTNTMHKVAGEIQQQISIPLLHIAEVTADALQQAGIHRAALLGTRYTMEQDFYKGRLTARGIEVLTPGAAQRTALNRIIFEELCLGILSEDSRAYCASLVADLQRAGAEGVILGCTEIGLLLTQEDAALPLFDTTVLHAKAAAEWALRE